MEWYRKLGDMLRIPDRRLVSFRRCVMPTFHDLGFARPAFVEMRSSHVDSDVAGSLNVLFAESQGGGNSPRVSTDSIE